MASREHRYYGWVVVGVVFVALLVSAGVRAAPTVLVNPLETTLGRSRATISIKLLLYGLSGPVSGGLMAAIMALLARWRPAFANPAEAPS
jgi:hypothetical protein